MTADGSKFTFLTYLGGSGDDNIAGLTLTSSGLVVAGTTMSSDFPIANAVQTAYPGNAASFYSSSDSGATWAGGVGFPSYSYVTNLSLDPSHPGTIVALASSSIYRSTDSGASWNLISSVSPSGVSGLSRSLSNPAILYAIDNYGNVWSSEDGGANWTISSFGYRNPFFLASADG